MACPDCFSGSIHEGTPTGRVETIHGLPTYIAEPADGATPKGLVVFIPDAFGWDFVNCRLLSDAYAKKGGYLVYLPDFMGGHSCDPVAISYIDKVMGNSSWYTKPYNIIALMSHMIPWKISTRLSVCKPRVFQFFQDLRTSPPPYQTDKLKIAAAGFCWGGKYCFLLAADPPSSRVNPYSATPKSTDRPLVPLIDCAFTAHPSNLSLPADVDAVTLPLSVIDGHNDMVMGEEGVAQMKEMLTVKKRGDYEVEILRDAKHGFGVRTDMKDAYQLECGDKAEKQALDWFAKWLS